MATNNENRAMSCIIDLDHFKTLEPYEILNIIDSARYLRLSVCENNQPYVIPMCYCYKKDGSNIVFYLYSKDSGQKMNCIKTNDKVALELEQQTHHGVISVVAFGQAVIKNDDPTMSIIEVTTNKITGRVYNFIC